MSGLSSVFLTSAAVLLVMAAEASAQTCAKTPSCIELGYTQSVADCGGSNFLYCPFDKNKVYCTKLNEYGDQMFYKNGETYTKYGYPLGRVFDATDCTTEGCRHGKIFTSPQPLTNSYLKAVNYCQNITSGGKNWRLPSASDYTKETNDASKISVAFLGNYFSSWVSEGIMDLNKLYVRPYPYWCTNEGLVSTSPSHNMQCSSVETLSKIFEPFFCVTDF